MATYYVRGENGSDSNSGLTYALAKKTINGLTSAYTLASADTICWYEKIRDNTSITGGATGGPALFAATGLSDVTLTWDGVGTAPDFRGDRELVQTGWVASSSAWQLTIAAGLSLDAVVYKWDASTDSSGRHYGHLIPDTLVNVKAGGATGLYNYDSGTGVLSVSLNGANPNTSGFPVAICVIGSNNAISFTGGSGNKVQGLTISLYPATSGNFGWSVIFDGSTGFSCTACVSRDAGFHNFGAYGNSGSSSNGRFDYCYAWGLAAGGTSFVFYQASANGSMTGRAWGCHAHVYRYLDTAGAARSGLATDAKKAFNAHSDGGTGINNVQFDGSTYHEYEVGDLIVDASHVNPPTDRRNFDQYGFRLRRCTATGPSGCAHQRMDSVYAFDCCLFDFRNAGPSGANDVSSRGWLSIGGAAGVALFRSCEIIADTTSGAFTKCIVSQDNGSAFYFQNTSMTDLGTTSGREWMIGNYTNSEIHADGCLFAFTSATALLKNDIGASFVRDFDNNAYYNIATNGWSEDGSFDSEAEFTNPTTGVDRKALVLSANPYPNPTVSLALTTASALWNRRRLTSTHVPPFGINGPYRHNYGAYQYGANDASTDLRVRRVSRP